MLGPELLLMPLHAWHHTSFDREPEVPGIPRAGVMTIADFAKCLWPEEVAGPEGQGGLQLALWADSINDGFPMVIPPTAGRATKGAGAAGDVDSGGTASQSLATAAMHVPHGCDIISFSHFVPDQRLVPEKRYLSFPNLVSSTDMCLAVCCTSFTFNIMFMRSLFSPPSSL